MDTKKERIAGNVGASSHELILGLKTKVRGGRVVGGIWGECWSVGAHQGSVLSPLIFAIVVDVVTKDA